MSVKEEAKKIFNDVKDDTKKFTKKEVKDGKGMGVLSYILPFIPFFVEKDNKFVKYHAIQGMNLLIVAIGYSILYSLLTNLITVRTSCGVIWGMDLGTCRITPWWVTWPLGLVGLGITAFAIIGIVNVCNGKAKELPIINKIKIFK